MYPVFWGNDTAMKLEREKKKEGMPEQDKGSRVRCLFRKLEE